MASDPFSLTGRVAAVTGGGSGIGLASAQALARAGARVAILDRNPVAAEILATLGDEADHFAVVADVADEASLEAAFQAVAERAQRLDILVNSAGTAIRRPAVELTVADWDTVVNVNMTGTFLASRIAARHMIASGTKGSIVNVSSIMGFSGGGLYPNISYQTTKGAIVNMTRALAVEWAPNGIRVNAVAPTYVRTPFIAGLVADPELVARIEAMTPLRRLADPEEVASAILFLAGPGASMVTGHTLPVDGGFLAQ
ncbi:SDR family NAD(P)-dependent oxidoreductase [Kaistia defluvii]|uniref:SDR family NAD(P)-dependent oxidoreductase n=1 Tax=Kaistia defluvii TaxID=410841 RepID=UPI00225098A1|nr:SDR family oxidoreductase [Kaistia defluvii]MCX5517324.1 SDR family NAD(P)-dependent oxidoreductase [Kaistia defluvii]